MYRSVKVGFAHGRRFFREATGWKGGGGDKDLMGGFPIINLAAGRAL